MRPLTVLTLACAVASACGDGHAGTDRDGGMTPTDAADADPDAGPGPTQLHIRIVDSKTRQVLPGMVTLFAPDGKRLQFGNWEDEATAGMGALLREVGTGGALATWHGLAIWRGEAIVPVGVDFGIKGRGVVDDRIPPARYRLTVNRGPEYDLTELVVDLTENRGVVSVEVPIARVVDTAGYLAADMHVHTGPGSGDTRITGRDRLKSMIVAGVDVVVSSDHDHHTDLGEAARELWPQPGDPIPIATITGNEATGRGGHFNVFPVVADRSRPRNGAPRALGDDEKETTQTFLDRLRALPGPPLVQMNHTRLGFAAYFDGNRCGPWRDRSRLPLCSVSFDAMEVLSGYLVCGTKIAEQMRDWHALLSFGVVTTATGNSDTHGTSRLLGGFPRTYVRVGNDEVTAFDEAQFVSALRARSAIATSGPFLTMRVNDSTQEGEQLTDSSGTVKVSLRMQAASWIVVDEVRLLVDGSVVKTFAVPRMGSATPLFEVQGEPIAIAADAFITAEAEGKKALPPFVVGDWTSLAGAACPPVPGAEQGMAVFATTNPVFVDRDGDGRFRGPRQPDLFPAAAN